MLQARKRVEAEYTWPASKPVKNPVKRPRSRFIGKKGTILLIAAACFVLSLVIIAQYSYMVSLHYQLSTAEARILELADEHRALELQAAQLGALSRIESVARIELGMREPESGQLRVLTASQEDGVHIGE